MRWIMLPREQNKGPKVSNKKKKKSINSYSWQLTILMFCLHSFGCALVKGWMANANFSDLHALSTLIIFISKGCHL
jgi:hypothetical protein